MTLGMIVLIWEIGFVVISILFVLLCFIFKDSIRLSERKRLLYAELCLGMVCVTPIYGVLTLYYNLVPAQIINIIFWMVAGFLVLQVSVYSYSNKKNNKKGINNSIVVAVFFIIFFTQSAFAAVFYVDKESIGGLCSDNNSGKGLDTPWCNIAKANSILGPGDTVYIRKGTYTDVIEPQKSGTPLQPITYKAYSNNDVIIQGRPKDKFVVNIGGLGTDWQSKSYIIIDGLQIKRGAGPLLNTRQALIYIYGSGSKHNVIRNCTLVGTEQPLLSAWDQGLRVGGISITDSSNNIIENNIIKNITYIGVVIGGTSPRFNIIRNNHIKNIVQDGIHIDAPLGNDSILGLLIEGNEIHGSLISDGIQANACYNDKESKNCVGVSGVIVRNNRVYNNAENSIDLKGTSHWVIENNVLYESYGNNDGGHKAQAFAKCDTPPCNNNWGGSNIGKGANRYSRDIIIRNNIIYDGSGGVIVWDGYILYNNTILNNRRTFKGPNQQICAKDGCSRHPGFPGVYGPGDDAIIINNIIGDNGFEVRYNYQRKWLIDYNLYYSTRPEPLNGFVQYFDKNQWFTFNLNDWQQYLKKNDNVSGKDEHSFVSKNPGAIFKRVGSAPFGSYKKFDFSPVRNAPVVDAGRSLTHAVQDGSGTLLLVKDARFFFDGYGVTTGDLVVVGTNRPVRITHVNYITNELHLAEPMSWKKGDSVNRPYSGRAPDIGAGNLSLR